MAEIRTTQTTIHTIEADNAPDGDEYTLLDALTAMGRAGLEPWEVVAHPAQLHNFRRHVLGGVRGLNPFDIREAPAPHLFMWRGLLFRADATMQDEAWLVRTEPVVRVQALRG